MNSLDRFIIKRKLQREIQSKDPVGAIFITRFAFAGMGGLALGLLLYVLVNSS